MIGTPARSSPVPAIKATDRFEWATDQSGPVPDIFQKSPVPETEEQKAGPSNLFRAKILCAVLVSGIIVAFLTAYIWGTQVDVTSPSTLRFPPASPPPPGRGSPASKKTPVLDYSDDTIFPLETGPTEAIEQKTDSFTVKTQSTTRRPLKMQSLQFTCGHFFYRTLHVDRRRELLFVGGMYVPDRLFKLDLSNINTSICGDSRTQLNLPARSDHVDNCAIRGGEKETQCRNHIKVLQPVGDGSRLYICGTSAKKPTDLEVYGENLTVVPDADRTPIGGSDAVGRCSLDIYDNNTAVWVDDAVDSGTSALFSGCVTNYDKTDPVVARTGIHDPVTGRRVYDYLRTDRFDTRMLREPSFVGSYAMDDYVYLFFREIAEEYRACGRITFSRVARVCKNDRGGGPGYRTKWTSFVKVRLNCSQPGPEPFYFDRIQNIYRIPGDAEVVYGVFTTPMYLGSFASAVCAFKKTDILAAFNGSFAEQKSSQALWGPVQEAQLPQPRPGLCSDDSRSLPDDVKNFLMSHPQLITAVPHDRKDGLVFYRQGVAFLSIAVTKVTVLGVEHTVYYVGTDNGRIFKLAEWEDRSGRLVSELLDSFVANPREPIWQLDISEKHKSLYAFSDDAVRQFRLDSCTRRYMLCTTCVKDPFCGWDSAKKRCKSYVDASANRADSATPSDEYTSDAKSRTCTDSGRSRSG